MNWKDDQIEKLILFYSCNSLFLVPEILQLVPETGTSFLSVCHGHKKVMFYSSLVCLSVYLLATLRKNYWSDVHENITGDVAMDKEELIKFSKSPTYRNFSWRSFHNVKYGILLQCGLWHLFRYVTNQPPKANSAVHPSGVGKWVPASAGKAKAGMVLSVSGWMRGVQVKLWDPLRTRAIPERLKPMTDSRQNRPILSANFVGRSIFVWHTTDKIGR